ncbi:uncharacterized protein LOC120330429 [Styela clava]
MERVAILLLLSCAPVTYGLNCYYCSIESYVFDNGDYCLTPAATPNMTCPNETYCQTIVTIEDGIVTLLERSCKSPVSDADTNDEGIPTTEKCKTNIAAGSNPVQNTMCYLPCSTDYCNNQTISEFALCTSNCSYGIGGGSCDYLTGKCVCNSGHTGSNCDVEVQASALINCVQCNSETDTNCASGSIKASPCPGAETYCSTTNTTIYDDTLTVVSFVVTRGCTTNFTAEDECSFSDVVSSISTTGYKEFTCYSTCSSNGCNTNKADGLLDANEKKHLLCNQCTSDTGDCIDFNGRSPCINGEKYCYAKVNYLISEREDETYKDPAYKIQSVTRGCTSTVIPTKCVNTPVPRVSFKNVTCTESCQWDGCNTGWPARPKCITCSSNKVIGGYNRDGYDECLQNPPEATDCEFPYEQYCYIYDDGNEQGRGTSPTGYPRRITRGCSYRDVGTSCSYKTLRGHTIQTCNRTCATDGCNVGNGSKKHMISGLGVILSTVITWLMKVHM